MERKLTNTSVNNAKPNSDGKPNKLSDGGGLFLLVKKTKQGVGKYWRYSYRFEGKQMALALGVFPDVGLADARRKHEQARRWLADGINPKEARDNEAREAKKQKDSTFETIAKEWMEYSEPDWSDSHIKTVNRLLSRDINPWMGNRPINEIEPPEVLRVLRRMEKRVGDSTRKAKQIIGQVFRHGVAEGYCDRDPTADLKGVIKKRPVEHYPAITEPVKLGELLRAIERSGGEYQTVQALKLSTMLMLRPQNIRFVEWSEVDFEAALLSIPASKIKLTQKLKNANRPVDGEVVPLPKQAIDILKDIKLLTGHLTYVFHTTRSKSGAMSENRINNALKRMGFAGVMTAHGFRATARTLLTEMGYRREVLEKALFHKEPNQVVAAYDRAEYLEERREMMQAWADYLDALREGAAVVPIHKKSA